MSAATIKQAEFIVELVRTTGMDASKYKTADFDEASAMIEELKAYREHKWRGLAITDGTRQAVVMRMREQGVTKDDLYPIANVVSLGREGGATESQGQMLLRHLAGEPVEQEARDPSPPKRTIASIPPEVRRRIRPGLLQTMLKVEVKPPAPPEPVTTVVNPPPVATNPHGTTARPVGRAVRGRPGFVPGAAVAAVVQVKPPEPEAPDDISFRPGCGRNSGRAGAGAGGETGDDAGRATSADGGGRVPGDLAVQASGPVDTHARRLDDPAVLNDPMVAAILATFPGSTILEIDAPCS